MPVRNGKNRRKPTQASRKHANSAQKGYGWPAGLNPECSCCEATVILHRTALKSCKLKLKKQCKTMLMLTHHYVLATLECVVSIFYFCKRTCWLYYASETLASQPSTYSQNLLSLIKHALISKQQFV